MIIKSCNGKAPQIHEEAYLAENVTIIGDVVLEKGANVWYGAVIRGDSCAIRVGENSNVQDCCCLHGAQDTTVGKNVTIGHGAIVHGCTVGDNTLIGMGAIVVTGAKIGSNCMVGAGALVTGKTVVPDGSLVLGNPAKVIRPLTEAEVQVIRDSMTEYLEMSRWYRQGKAEWPIGKAGV